MKREIGNELLFSSTRIYEIRSGLSRASVTPTHDNANVSRDKNIPLAENRNFRRSTSQRYRGKAGRNRWNGA